MARDIRTIAPTVPFFEEQGGSLKGWESQGGVKAMSPGSGSRKGHSAVLTAGKGLGPKDKDKNKRIANLSQWFKCSEGKKQQRQQCRVKFDYKYVKGPGTEAEVHMISKTRQRETAALPPSNDGGWTTVQVAYPECGEVLLFFSITQNPPGDGWKGELRIDNIQHKCNTKKYKGIPELKWKESENPRQN
jgi:hypothetical protein